MAVGYALPSCAGCGAPAEIHLCQACYEQHPRSHHPGARIRHGLARARAAGQTFGCPRVISAERLQAIRQALAQGMPKAGACQVFGVKRTTLYDALARDREAHTSGQHPTPCPDPGLRPHH